MSSTGADNPSWTVDVPTESVWDYPRPPRLERCRHKIRVVFGGQTVAETLNAYRVLESSHPPTYYIPLSDVRSEFLLRSSRRTWCEWKGEAHYWNLRGGTTETVDAAWSYPRPTKPFAAIRDYVAFYPARVDAATSVTSGSKHRKAIFTAAGSPVTCAARSRAGPAPPAGNGLPHVADRASCCDTS